MKNILILLLFAGGYTAWFFYHQKSGINEGLAAAQNQITDLEKAIAGKRAEAQAVSKVLAIKVKIAEQKAALAEVQKKTKSVNDAHASTLKAKYDTLASIRQKFIGVTMPIVLASGRDLGQVRIMKMDDAGLSVATTSGVVKIVPNELPPALQVQFLYSF
jgi:hypothetical protein